MPWMTRRPPKHIAKAMYYVPCSKDEKPPKILTYVWVIFQSAVPTGKGVSREDEAKRLWEIFQN